MRSKGQENVIGIGTGGIVVGSEMPATIGTTINRSSKIHSNNVNKQDNSDTISEFAEAEDQAPLSNRRSI